MSRSGSMEVDGETTKKVSMLALKARFEQKANSTGPAKRNFVINKGKGAAKKFDQKISTTKCLVCNRSVYPMEKLEVEGQLFHKLCFKCETCNRTLGLGNYAALERKYYCKPHLKQLFQLKGNYDEGFGREQRKSDWVKKGGPPPESSTPASNLQNEEPQNEELQNEEPHNVEPHNVEPQNGEPQNGELQNGEPQNGVQHNELDPDEGKLDESVNGGDAQY